MLDDNTLDFSPLKLTVKFSPDYEILRCDTKQAPEEVIMALSL